MKRFIKYSSYLKTFLFAIFFLTIIFIDNIKADLIKPNVEIKPDQVVKIQLNSLMNNNQPNIDDGIKQTWEFAHPSNKKYTGPLPKFINLLKSDTYKMLINHLDSEITEVFKSNNQYGFKVIILGNDKKYYAFQWMVEKYYDEGPLKDCWLTTSVSNPVSLGSSI